MINSVQKVKYVDHDMLVGKCIQNHKLDLISMKIPSSPPAEARFHPLH